MTIAELSLALMVLLLTPGPTNTLMLMAGAERGWARSLWLIPVEVVAYLAVIVPLALLAQGLAEQMWVLRPVVAVLAGLWVLYLAFRMWRTEPIAGQQATVTRGRLALTTFLNPKGLIMGLVLLPAAGATGAAFAVLVVAIVVVAAFWAGLGGAMPGAGAGSAIPVLWRRVAAVWLAGLSVMIVAGGIGT
jgi:threonine/homoserine/homoserine lactone efflux protein